MNHAVAIDQQNNISSIVKNLTTFLVTVWWQNSEVAMEDYDGRERPRPLRPR
jgi:hypothetical protein